MPGNVGQLFTDFINGAGFVIIVIRTMLASIILVSTNISISAIGLPITSTVCN